MTATTNDSQSCRTDFAAMQQKDIIQLRLKLVQHAINPRFKAVQPGGWASETLRQYALQYYEHMEKRTRPHEDLFYKTGENSTDRQQLGHLTSPYISDAQAECKRELLLNRAPGRARFWGTTASHEAAPLGFASRRDGRRRDTHQRIGMAAFAAALLIAPLMWPMVVHNTVPTDFKLVSTAAALLLVAVFGVMAAYLYYLNARAAEVVSCCTAAYADALAVLVDSLLELELEVDDQASDSGAKLP